MPVLATDILLKSALETALRDLRANPYLLYDVFGGLAGDPISTQDYGNKEVRNAIDWFTSNQIDVYLQHRLDTPVFPSIILVDGGSNEDEGRAELGDGGDTEDFDPTASPGGSPAVQSTPQYVYFPMTLAGYSPASGLCTLPGAVLNDLIVAGQFLVSARSGKAYQILTRVGSNQFTIASGVSDDFTGCYVLPPTQLWNLERERTWKKHSWAIICAAKSDSIFCRWLNQVVEYSLMRYKEALLEGRGAELSTWSTSPIVQEPKFLPERVFFQQVTCTFTTELSVIKYVAPKFQAVRGKIAIANGPKTPLQWWTQAVKNSNIIMQGDEGRKD